MLVLTRSFTTEAARTLLLDNGKEQLLVKVFRADTDTERRIRIQVTNKDGNVLGSTIAKPIVTELSRHDDLSNIMTDVGKYFTNSTSKCRIAVSSAGVNLKSIRVVIDPSRDVNIVRLDAKLKQVA